MWIFENKDWPNFTWNENVLSQKLALIRYRQGLLLGKMENLGFELRQEASLKTLTDDVIKSTAIEGENLNREEVRSSIARRLGLDVSGLIPSSRNVEGVVEMMLDATQRFLEPLNAERLFNWHAALFPTGRSGVISGPLGREKVHFEAIGADKIESEVKTFLKWFENKKDIDPVLKAGIAHLWFITIHPFEDGNGRIARALLDMALARADGTSNRFYSLSSQIECERKDYYNQLEQQQRGSLDITGWIQWFLGCLGRAISSAEVTLSNVLFKDKLMDKINQKTINDRQRLIISRMLEDDFKGYINTSKYAKLAKCSDDTALRDIQELKSRGILIQNPGGGRSTSYHLIEEIDQENF